MKPSLRDLFDRHLEIVLAGMPARVHELLDEVPLVVEDHPSRELMRKTGMRHRTHLCGLYTGIPLTERSVEHSGILSDVVHIFREGIMSLAVDRQGNLDEQELQRQIRITVLHELGHHHGLGERELRELGY
jgi:predicted Zn-dependent protease with MMP-like domain